MTRVADKSWRKIFQDYGIENHSFAKEPFIITSKDINKSCQNFTTPGGKESRILCKQDFRGKRPDIFVEMGLFILPIKNGVYALIEGEGYVDIPEINSTPISYQSKLAFVPDTSLVGSSEMQHLDYAYATSLIRSFMNDDTLILTLRGRKFSTKGGLSFHAGRHKHLMAVHSVQMEVDGGYEGEDILLLIEAKNSNSTNVMIRQLYYPFRQWQAHTEKPISLLFFEKRSDMYCFWRFKFDDVHDYNSIRFVDSMRYTISA